MVFKINSEDIEVHTIETNVSREFTSNDILAEDMFFNDIIITTTTGSLSVLPRKLYGLKDFNSQLFNTSSTFTGDNNLYSKLEEIRQNLNNNAGMQASLEAYMNDIHQLSNSAKFDSKVEVLKFNPPPESNITSQKRLFFQQYAERNPVKFGHEYNWSTTNYHCLNFFTSSESPRGVLIYPTKLGRKSLVGGTNDYDNYEYLNPTLSYYSGTNSYISSYQLHGPFSFQFWIKPKYNAMVPHNSFVYTPGCVLHYSSSYAITLHSGSQKDQNGNPEKFRIALQLGTLTNILPNNLVVGTDILSGSLGSVFWSSDNSIDLNKWTCVTITYGGFDYNQGTGSIWINAEKDKDIAIGPLIPCATWSLNPNGNFWGALYLGNYYRNLPQPAQNPGGTSSFYDQSLFWGKITTGGFIGTGWGDVELFREYAVEAQTRKAGANSFPKNKTIWQFPPQISSIGGNYEEYDSTVPFVGTGDSVRTAPFNALNAFRNPLNGELHDITLWRKQLSKEDILRLNEEGPRESDLEDLTFWVPPFFINESTRRITEPATPFAYYTSQYLNSRLSSSFPFSPKLAMSTNGIYINLENYVIDLATDNPPRLFELTWFNDAFVSPSIQGTSNQWLYEEGFLGSSARNKQRLYTVLPCDHGNYRPSFDLIEILNHNTIKMTNSFGTKTPGRINLQNSLYYVFNSVAFADPSEINSSTIYDNTAIKQNSITAYSENNISSSIMRSLLGPDPSAIFVTLNDGYTIWHRLQSTDSHFIVLFDISNLFYDQSIKPGSLEIETKNFKWNLNSFGMKLKDNGRGGLYRADADGDHAQWSTVGLVMYEEGLIAIKYPQLYFFGQAETMERGESSNWTIRFKGTRDVHVYTINATAMPLTCTESADPNFTNIPLENQQDYDPNEIDRKQVFIGSVLIHDENLNVIMKSQISQPILKKSSDKIKFRISTDW